MSENEKVDVNELKAWAAEESLDGNYSSASLLRMAAAELERLRAENADMKVVVTRMSSDSALHYLVRAHRELREQGEDLSRLRKVEEAAKDRRAAIDMILRDAKAVGAEQTIASIRAWIEMHDAALAAAQDKTSPLGVRFGTDATGSCAPDEMDKPIANCPPFCPECGVCHALGEHKPKEPCECPVCGKIGRLPVTPFTEGQIEFLRVLLSDPDQETISSHSARGLLATLDSKDREIAALRGLIDTLSFCYDQPVGDLALMVNANAERDARERT